MSYLVTRQNRSTGRIEYLQPDGSLRAFKVGSSGKANARRFTTWAAADAERCSNEGITQI